MDISADTGAAVALLVPTYRHTPQVAANLAYLAALSRPDIRVFISDSSGDADKHRYLLRLQAGQPFLQVIIRPQRVPLYAKIAALLETVAAYRYVAICGDDDYMSLDYVVQSVDVLERDSATICSHGIYLLWLHKPNDLGAIYLGSRDAIQSSPIARLAQGFDPNHFNALFFAVFRRSAMTPWLNFCNGHPMPGPFLDFIHCWSLLAQGMVRCHQRGFYLWTGENWATPDSNLRSRVSYYNAIGLPDAFGPFHDLHFAVEGLHFFLGEHSPITDRETRIACAQTVWSRCMDRFRLEFDKRSYLDALRPAPRALDAARHLIRERAFDVDRIIDWFTTIVAVYSEPQAKIYAEHVRASLARANILELGHAD
jgi:glycosyltransferase domain-containing protein